ncbi:hypothetical protein BDY24DRAFT_398548 [Mrakia frigida]|uniref:uncharacterized protein n=1 Tax=Mrakia frigida TaxID=29902 RepID=UPI003FCC1BE5
MTRKRSRGRERERPKARSASGPLSLNTFQTETFAPSFHLNFHQPSAPSRPTFSSIFQQQNASTRSSAPRDPSLRFSSTSPLLSLPLSERCPSPRNSSSPTSLEPPSSSRSLVESRPSSLLLLVTSPLPQKLLDTSLDLLADSSSSSWCSSRSSPFQLFLTGRATRRRSR